MNLDIYKDVLKDVAIKGREFIFRLQKNTFDLTITFITIKHVGLYIRHTCCKTESVLDPIEQVCRAVDADENK